MKIALAQIYPTLGNLAANYALLEKEILAARQNGARLIIFPELALTGYLLKDQVFDLLPGADEYLPKLKKLSAGIDIILGSIESQNSRAYNAAFYLSGGELVHTHRKVYLPTYGMFDEKRYFSAGSQFQTFASVLGPTAILICEDAWHFSSAYLAASAGAENVVIISSSPYRAGIEKQWQNIQSGIAENLAVNVLYCNRAGVEDGVTFWGGSVVYTDDGQPLGRAAELKPETLLLDLPENREARQQSVFVRDERPEVVLKELSRIWQSVL
ncbi:carbon-nitrogen hydrolase [Candidatus Termititenax aidoneus]|uniref:Carbon-nitrogen hydrolase n=1 Tax=Termititenax aidoneus TaxID=2218524 RepID=A0A388T8V9_TERA1|nr:carbon-nitrogen hydrolase [Candidatus Termititenax aidoneus]